MSSSGRRGTNRPFGNRTKITSTVSPFGSWNDEVFTSDTFHDSRFSRDAIEHDVTRQMRCPESLLGAQRFDIRSREHFRACCSVLAHSLAISRQIVVSHSPTTRARWKAESRSSTVEMKADPTRRKGLRRLRHQERHAEHDPQTHEQPAGRGELLPGRELRRLHRRTFTPCATTSSTFAPSASTAFVLS